MRRTVRPSVGTWWSDVGRWLGVVLGAALCSLAIPGNALAATIVVNSLADTVASGDGACTLREAVLNAERDNPSGSTDCAAGSGADTITFSLSGTISLDPGLTIASAGGITIDGGGRMTINGGGFNLSSGEPHEAIGVAPTGVMTLKNLTVTDGGGISNRGTMTISYSTIRNYTSEASISSSSNYYCGGYPLSLAHGHDCGAIRNSGTMTISDSTVSGNFTTADWKGDLPGGSGIVNRGTMTISTSTINDNTLQGPDSRFQIGSAVGGAIFNAREATLTITNTTVARNVGGDNTGLVSAIYNEGMLRIDASTVSDNDVSPIFPALLGIFNSGTVRLSTSLITDGCSDTIISLGSNLDKTGSCGLAGPGDKTNIDPRLDPAGLRDNGGPTQTIALCTGTGTPTGCTGKSPAIDAVPLAQCTGAGGQPLGLDQRTFFRPADGDRNGTSLCDMGAFEASSKPLQTVNSLVSFTPLPATYQTSRDTTGCPAGYVGKFHFTADLATKPGSPPLSHLVAEVATLTKGNVVLNADGGLGGAGATVTIGPSAQYTDGVLSAKEHIGLPVTLCLKTFNQFSFFVDVLGTH